MVAGRRRAASPAPPSRYFRWSERARDLTDGGRRPPGKADFESREYGELGAAHSVASGLARQELDGDRRQHRGQDPGEADRDRVGLLVGAAFAPMGLGCRLLAAVAV